MSLTEEQLKPWKDLVEWLVEQDEFVLIGLKDNVVNAKSSVEVVDAYGMVGMVFQTLSQNLESRDPEDLQTLQ